MSSFNLYDRLLPNPPQPDPAVIFTTEAGAVWTTDDVRDLTGRMASLLQRSSVAPGDRVAAQVEKTVEAVCLYLACLQVGAIFLPLNTAYTLAELDHFIGDADPVIVVKGSEGARLPDSASHVRTFGLGPDGAGSLADEARLLEPLHETVPRDGDDLAAILYTSGTTGRSKGAMITHGNLGYMADALKTAWGMTSADTLLHALPVYHAHGLFIALNTALVSSTPMHFLSKFTVDAVVEKLPSSTVFMGVPTFYARLNNDPRVTKDLCGNLRLFVSGSAPLSVPAFEEFARKTGHKILERYAMTETTVITSNPLHGERVAGTVGFALPQVLIRVIGDEAQELPRGNVGEIALQGPNLFKGYWRLPEKTAAEFTADGYFRTGDLGLMSEDGRLAIVGRNKDLIITGGYNVYPGEVEAVIGRIDGIASCAVIGVPHADFGEGVVAVLEWRSGYETLDPEAIIAAISGELAKYKLPKRVVTVEQMPCNVLGKIQKNELRSSLRRLFS